MNIETYIAYVQLLYGTSGYGEALEKYSCVLNQSGSCGDTFEIDARNGLPKKMRVTGTFCDLDVIFCKKLFIRCYMQHIVEVVIIYGRHFLSIFAITGCKWERFKLRVPRINMVKILYNTYIIF